MSASDDCLLESEVRKANWVPSQVSKARSSKDTTVDEIMISAAITIAPDCSVDGAMRIMTENRVRHLPVISHNGSISGRVGEDIARGYALFGMVTRRVPDPWSSGIASWTGRTHATAERN